MSAVAEFEASTPPPFVAKLIDAGGKSFDIRYFGAIGDGVSDDTVAFQQACACGAAIYIPEGFTFIVTSQLKPVSNAKFYGTGTIKFGDNCTGRMFLVQNVSNVSFFDVTMDMNKANNVDGGDSNNQQAIYVNGSIAMQGITVTNTTILNSFHNGIQVTESGSGSISNVTITSNHISQCLRGIYILLKLGLNTSIFDNTIDTCGLQAINCVGAPHVYVGYNNVSGCGDHGISVGGNPNNPYNRASIVGNCVSGSAKYGIAISWNVQYARVYGNECSSNGYGSITVDVERSDSLGILQYIDCVVAANDVHDESAIGIHIRMSIGVNVVANNCQRCTTTGITLATCATGSIVSNSVANCGNGIDFQEASGVTSGGYILGANTMTNNTTDYNNPTNPTNPPQFLSVTSTPPA